MSHHLETARPDPLLELAASFRRDGLTEDEVSQLLVKVGTVIAASAETSGSDRAVRAAAAAVSQLPADQFKRARGILVDVLGPSDLTRPEIDAAAETVHRAAGPDGDILFGAWHDEGMEGFVKVTVIACGIE